MDGINLYACQDKNLIYRYRASISYVSQAVFIGEKTILENITYEVNQNNVNTEKLEKIAKQLDINKFITELKDGYHTLIRDTSLSGGQKQKIALARALYKDSDIIILDEVTNNLDIESQNNLVNIIKRLKGKVTIILVSHKKNILDLCDNLYKLNKSKLMKI